MQPTPSFFEGVSTAVLDAALHQVERRHLRSGSVILAEGDVPSEMYVLAAGSAEVVLVDRGGVEHVVSSIRAGEAIGEMSLLTGNPASATVRAVEDVELLVLREPDLDRLAEDLPELQRNLIAALAARLTRVTRLAVQEQPGRVVVLEDGGGPELLGYLLAASIAWHTRGRTVHVILGRQASPALAVLVTVAPEPPFRPARAAGADLLLADLRHRNLDVDALVDPGCKNGALVDP
jgi:CRP-like cAMP-binding protein